MSNAAWFIAGVLTVPAAVGVLALVEEYHRRRAVKAAAR